MDHGYDHTWYYRDDTITIAMWPLTNHTIRFIFHPREVQTPPQLPLIYIDRMWSDRSSDRIGSTQCKSQQQSSWIRLILGSTQYSNQAWSTDMVHAVSLAHIPILFATVDFSLFSWYGLFRIRERSCIHVVLQVIRSENLESPLIHFTTDSNRCWTWPC